MDHFTDHALYSLPATSRETANWSLRSQLSAAVVCHLFVLCVATVWYLVQLARQKFSFRQIRIIISGDIIHSYPSMGRVRGLVSLHTASYALYKEVTVWKTNFPLARVSYAFWNLNLNILLNFHDISKSLYIRVKVRIVRIRIVPGKLKYKSNTKCLCLFFLSLLNI